MHRSRRIPGLLPLASLAPRHTSRSLPLPTTDASSRVILLTAFALLNYAQSTFASSSFQCENPSGGLSQITVGLDDHVVVASSGVGSGNQLALMACNARVQHLNTALNACAELPSSDVKKAKAKVAARCVSNPSGNNRRASVVLEVTSVKGRHAIGCAGVAKELAYAVTQFRGDWVDPVR